VPSTDVRGNTPLHYAVYCLDIATAELLLGLSENGLCAENAAGLTPLMVALELQHFYDVPGYLDVDVDAQDMVDLLGTGSLSDRSWLGDGADKIAQILVAAGSPLPENLQETGAYSFLLRRAASAVFSAASPIEPSEGGEAARLECLLLQAFHNFDFIKRPSPRTNLLPLVTFAPSMKQIQVFPGGV
jgi:hypothetical protein